MVEDRPQTSGLLSYRLGKEIPGIQIDIAADAKTATQFFAANDYDLTLLDLEIPALPDSLAADKVNGERLLLEFTKSAPGAPICVLTAHGTVEGTSRALTTIRHFDVFGENDVPSLCFIPKDHMRLAIILARRVSDVAVRLETDIDARIESPAPLTEIDRRLLLWVAKSLDADRLVAKRFGSGLSSSSVFAVLLYRHGAPRGMLAVKLGSAEKCLEEFDRYQKLVAPLIVSDALANVIGSPLLLGRRGALSYRLASSRDRSLFQLAFGDDQVGANVVRHIAAVEEPWFDGVPVGLFQIGELRRVLVADAEMTAAQRAIVSKCEALEGRRVPLRKAFQHGDFHGDNVLCSATGAFTIIDYADVGRLPAPADSVMLELSFAFHPAARELSPNWPAVENVTAYCAIEGYSVGSKWPKTLAACRTWTEQATEKVGDRGAYALGYAYAVWQAGFTEEIFDLADALATACSERI